MQPLRKKESTDQMIVKVEHVKKSGFYAFQRAFIMVEDVFALHQPIHKEYSEKEHCYFPELYWQTPIACCPFVEHLERRPSTKRPREKRNIVKAGYCECCYRKYSDIEEVKSF